MIPHRRLIPGTVLDGRYRVERLIKAGGMGAVYQVTDQTLNRRTCALKEMIDPSTGPADRQAAIDRFLSEIQVMQDLSHPNIPRVWSSFVHENSFYFVMEFVEGTDLAHVLKEQGGGGGLPADRVVGWALQVLDALDYLHRRSPAVTHRDIKPSNLLLRTDGRVMLVDFGIARVVNPADGYWIGTPGYAPPEQRCGRPEPRSDLYALGATMHELLSGRKPSDHPFPPFRELGAQVDRALEELVFRALELSPEDRFSSALEMSEALRALPGYEVRLPEAGREHDFETAVRALKLETLDPLLQDLIERYANECHTPYLPRNLDFLQFTLACPTPFELQVVKDTETGRVRFYEKHGILDPLLLGEVDPLASESRRQVPAIVARFVEDYERFKNANWQMLG